MNEHAKVLSQRCYASSLFFKWVYRNPWHWLVDIRHIPAYHVDYTTAQRSVWVLPLKVSFKDWTSQRWVKTFYLRRTLFLSTWGKLRTSIRKHSASLYQFNFHACSTKPAEFDLLVINQWMTVLWHFKRKPKKPSTPTLWAWFQPVLTAVSFTPDRTTWVRSPEAEIREDHSVYPIQIQSALRRYHENRMHTEPLVKSYGATWGTENSI